MDVIWGIYAIQCRSDTIYKDLNFRIKVIRQLIPAPRRFGQELPAAGTAVTLPHGRQYAPLDGRHAPRANGVQLIVKHRVVHQKGTGAQARAARWTMLANRFLRRQQLNDQPVQQVSQRAVVHQ